MRLRILFFALSLVLTQTPAVEASKTTKPVSAPAIGPTGGFVYRYVSNKQQRKDSKNKWQSTDARKQSNFDPIRVAAYNSLNSLTVDSSFANFEFEYVIPSAYPKSIERVVRLQIEKVAGRFSPLLTTKEIAKIIFITEKDKSWVSSELPKIVPPNEYGGALEILNFYGTKEKFYSRAGTGGGIAGYIPEKGYSFYISHTSSLATLDTYWPEVPPHEFAHVLQGVLSGGFRGEFPDGHPEAKWQGHLIEGSANTLGMALGFETLGWYSDEMDRLLKRDIQTYRSWRKLNSVNDAVAFIKSIETRDSEQANQFSYSAGQFVWEYFIGKYGPEKFFEFLRNINKTANFNENLKTTIGKDRESFYLEAGAYLLKNWKRLS
jgi:hypothetical protein